MHHTSATNTLQSHLRQTLVIALAVLGTVMATTSTAAACGPSGQTQPAVLRQAPIFPAMAPALAGGPAATGESAEDTSQRGIVGLWHVFYTDSTGALFYEAYDMWHADGNEWETSLGDPRQGNYCLGVWTKVGLRTVQLSHFGWLYNSDGTPAGYFTLAETDTVNSNGDSYSGTFDFKQYDTNGNFLAEVTGTQAATRFHL